MKKQKRISLFFYMTSFLCMCTLFISCNNTTDYKASIRIELVSSGNQKVDASIYIENELGCIVNGALVYITYDDNSIIILNYDNNKNCYNGLLDRSRNNKYFITIKSTLFGKKQYIIPHNILTEPPVLETFSDSDGNSYFLGNSLNSQKTIRISWDSDVENCIYKISVKNSIDTLFELSTNNTTLEIPAETLQNDSEVYYLRIQQQKSFGDLLFEKENYYSVSIISTENYIFSLY